MASTLEERFTSAERRAARRPRVTLLQKVVDYLRHSQGDVAIAKRLAAADHCKASARTWAKAKDVWTSVQPVPVLSERAQLARDIRTTLDQGTKRPTTERVVLKLTGNGPSVKARQRVEQTIVLVTAQALLDAGYLLGVNDGEEITVHHCRDIDKIHAALFTTDEDYLFAYQDADQDDPLNVEQGSKNDRPDAWVRCIYGNDGWDVISDWCPADTLEKAIGEGTVVQKLIDHASEYGTVPDLYKRDGKLTATV